MKVLEIIPHLQSGGGEKFVVDFSNAISSIGHDCTVVTLLRPSNDDILRNVLTSRVKTDTLSKKLGIDIGCMYRLYNYVKQAKPDVVHLHLNAITYSVLAAIFYRKCKYVATLHSEASREAGSGLNKYIRKFLFGTKIVTPVTISSESEKSFEDFYGYKTIMIPNGSSFYNKPVNNPWEKYRKEVDFLFIHAGRISSVKNQLMLVKCFDQLIKAGRNVRLLIAGRIVDDDIFQQMKPYFSDKIIYIGEQQDIRAIMSICDAFCLTSRMEGMPITIIEAFSVGCVPITTPVGGCINMIQNGENGYLSEEVSVGSFVSAVERFIDLDENKIKKMKQQCVYDYKTNYSIESSSNNYLKLFTDGE